MASNFQDITVAPFSSAGGAPFFRSNGQELSSKCSRCESWPPGLEGPGTLHLWFPLADTQRRVRQLLERAGAAVTDQEQMLTATTSDTDLGPLARMLEEALSLKELAEIRVIFQQIGQVLGPTDFLGSFSLAEFIGRTQVGWLLAMVQEERLTSVFQPIVRCSDASVYGYECLMRGHEAGRVVSPAQILGVARQAGLLFQLDLAGRRSAIMNAARVGLTKKIFINFTPTAIYSPKNCLRQTVGLIKECGFKPEDVVFEVIESDKVEDVKQLVGILDFYRERGFLVALDDLGAGYSSLNLLASLKPHFVKFDRDLVRDVDTDPYKATIASKLIETASQLGVCTVGEGVETEAEFHWLRSRGVDYAQGYLLGRPSDPPPVVRWQPEEK